MFATVRDGKLPSMKRRPFGKHGFDVGEIGFGAWAIGGSWGPQGDEDSLAALDRALDLGANLIDTAAGYGDGRSERLVARAIEGREGITVATKTPPAPGDWPPAPYDDPDARYGEAYLRENLAERLANLETDRIDVLQLHTWTRAWNADPTPLARLRTLQDEGKIGLIGVSTPEHDQNCVIDLMRDGWVDAVQVIYNLFEQGARRPAPRRGGRDRHGGDRARRVRRGRADPDDSPRTPSSPRTTFGAVTSRATAWSGRSPTRRRSARTWRGTGYTMPQAAIKFALAHPAVSVVIPGMRNAAQAEANLRGERPARPLARTPHEASPP